MCRTILLLYFVLLLPVSAAFAARPMITDDARLTDAKACQVESWIKFNRDSTEKWALPACNPGGNLELSLGGGVGEDSQGVKTHDVMIQAKTLLKPLETNGYGVGLALGNVRHPAISTGSDLYAYVPVSFSFKDDVFVLHTNLGVLRSRDEGKNHLTWGVGSETQATPNLAFIAETFGQETGRGLYQLGLRYWVAPNRVQVDTTFGNRFGSSGDERWFSIGLRLISPPFFP